MRPARRPRRPIGSWSTARRITALPLLLALAAAPGCGVRRPPASDTGTSDALVRVDCPRELRGAWVATVANIDFPSAPGLDAADQEAELTRLVDLLAGLHFNAVFFQVRPEGDALYRSDLEPWSRYLTGRQGGDPGYDPLAFLVRQAHARGLEVHAWFDPYRAASSRDAPLVAPHLAVLSPRAVYPYGALVWMDPGRDAVRERAAAVVLDVVRRYDVDGVHFDDYFYPYPNGTPFPDDATYAAYVAGGGKLDRDAWRRGNVDALVREVSTEVRAARPRVRFGVSPFGIYRPGEPEGIRGLDQVSALHADPLHWAAEGWVDYLAPQLYWPTTQTAQAYGTLLDWWAAQVGDHATLYAGNYLSQAGTSPAWSLDELRTQRALAEANPAVKGDVWFSASPLLEDRDGVRGLFADLYAEPALPPALPRVAGQTVQPPEVRARGTTLRLHHPDAAHLRGYAIYAEQEGEWRMRSFVPAGEVEPVTLPAGRYAVTAVARGDVESFGVRVDLVQPAAPEAPGPPPSP